MALFYPNLVAYSKYSGEAAEAAEQVASAAKGGKPSAELGRYARNAKDSIVDTVADVAAAKFKIPAKLRKFAPLAIDLAPKVTNKSSNVNDALLATFLATAPIPGLGAGYMAHQSAKKGPDDKYWGHFASGMIPGTAAGIGAGVGGAKLTNMLTDALGKRVKIPSKVLKWAPLAGAAVAGALAEPLAADAGLQTYKFFNRD